jgi:hypothetical protein
MEENPERDLLLKLLRGEPVPEVNLEQWQGIIGLAQKHGVESLLYRQLDTPGWKGRLPAESWQTLRADYMQEASQNTWLYHELGTILSAFHQADIPVIPLKGAFLAEHIYGNVALRPMRDVDLMVKTGDLWRVEEILTGMNYLRLRPGKGEDASRHVEFRHARIGLTVEIHWNLAQEALGLHIDVPGVWKRTRPSASAGVPVAALSPEDLLLHLSMHAADHGFDLGLCSICDINETLRHFQSQMDWACVQGRARSWQATRCAYVALWLARKLLEATIPEGFLDSLKPQASDQPYLDIAEDQLFAGVETTGGMANTSVDTLQTWSANSIQDKLAILFRRIFLSRHVMAMKYRLPPGSLRLFLYYPVHLMELLQRNGRPGWRLLIKGASKSRDPEDQNEAVALRSWLFSG